MLLWKRAIAGIGEGLQVGSVSSSRAPLLITFSTDSTEFFDMPRITEHHLFLENLTELMFPAERNAVPDKDSYRIFLQLSWNYNYGAFEHFLRTRKINVNLVENPNLVYFYLLCDIFETDHQDTTLNTKVKHFSRASTT